MKKLLAIIIFVFDVITGPFICIGVSVYLLIRYTLFSSTCMHWYDGIVITKDYLNVMLKQLEKGSYNNIEWNIFSAIMPICSKLCKTYHEYKHLL